MGIFKSLIKGSRSTQKKPTTTYKRNDEQDSLMVNNNLKGIELEKQGKIEEAIKLYEYNVQHRFDGNHPYDRLAIIYHKQEKYEDEIRVLKQAIDVFEHDLNPSRSDKSPKLARFKEKLQKVENKA